MTNAGKVYRQTAYDIYLEVMPGQKYSLNVQCIQLNGPGSYFCGVSWYKDINLFLECYHYLKYNKRF